MALAVAYVVALLLVFLGERVFSTIPLVREALTGVGALGVVGLAAARWVLARRADGERRSVARALAILSTLGALAVLVYLATAEPFGAMLGLAKLRTETKNRVEAAATVAWIALVVCAVLPMLFAERALFPMRRADTIEWRRVRDAAASGLVLGLAALYGALFVFVAGELDVKADFSYFHTARPSESTRKIAASAKDPLRVVAFFPPLNDVGVEVGAYLRDLAGGGSNVRVELLDRLLSPELAKGAKVTEDGVIVLERGPQREVLSLGTDLQAARPKLKTLDADFQKALLKVLRDKKNAYLTVGHGELGDAPSSEQNQGRTGKGIRQIFEQQNYGLHDLGAATGLGVDVPADATIVAVLGPDQAFTPEEVASLHRYADRGGRLLLCLDPDAKIDLAPLADVAGVTVSTSLLANDKVHLRRRFNDSDRLILATNRYSSHAAVSTLSRIGSRPVFFLGAGAVDKKTGGAPGFAVDLAVRALPDTFDDENANLQFDAPAEKRQSWGLAAAVTKGEMRAFVLGDADAVSDAALANDGNALLVVDAIRWLTGEESFAGMIGTPEDVRIEHTKQKDLAWFYGTIFVAPGIVLGGGLWYARRARRTKRAEKPS